MHIRFCNTLAYASFFLCFLFTPLQAVAKDSTQKSKFLQEYPYAMCNCIENGSKSCSVAVVKVYCEWCGGYGCYPGPAAWEDACNAAVPGNTTGWYIPPGGAFDAQPNGCKGNMCGPIEHADRGCTVEDNPDCPPPPSKANKKRGAKASGKKSSRP